MIKIDENASKALGQHPTNDVSRVTSKERNVTKSQRSISDPTAMT